MQRTKHRLFRLHQGAWPIALALVGAIILGMAIQHYAPGLGLAGASDARGDAPIRATAVRLADGRVEIGIQAQQPDGSWGDVILPDLRYVPSDAAVGRRLHSSVVALPAYYPRPESIEELQAGTEGYYSESPLYCVINHGAADDFFWGLANRRASESARFSRDNVRIVSNPDGAAQAAAIRECAADGAVALAATLAAPAAVGDALREAAAAGVQVLTFNSGEQHSRDVGAFAHLGLDDWRGGEVAGEWLNAQGVAGEVQCLIHERDNIGLTQRCDGLESVYSGGSVERLDISVGVDEVVASLADSTAAALVALNVDNTAAVAAGLAESGRSDITLIGFGAGPSVLQPLLSGQVKMVIWDQPDLQGHLVAHLLTLPERLFTGLAALELGSPFIAIEPIVYDLATIRELLAGLSPEARQQVMQAAAGG
ncbi:MAG: substrate-binding domain-containing protein [Chloroflexi bacterium]|nr:substrate-binding domain-containing protein [Chloroflexota bacterium]